MRDIFIVLSGVLTAAATLPYLRDTIRGKTKPRVVSWFTWTILMGISCAAALAGRQYPAGILLLCSSIGTLLIVIFGLKHGDRRFERFDIVCQVGALVGLLLWLIFNSPMIAILASVTIDFVGALPTFKHTWQQPYEETWVTFALFTLGSACTLAATTSWSVTALVYPLYLTIVTGTQAGIVLVRKRYVVAGEPAELRDL